MKQGQIILIAAGIILIAGLAVVLTGIPSSFRSPMSGGSAALAAVEVRSYQGADLSSVNDFRENSIRGPQHVNIPEYRLMVTGLTNTTDIYT